MYKSGLIYGYLLTILLYIIYKFKNYPKIKLLVFNNYLLNTSTVSSKDLS